MRKFIAVVTPLCLVVSSQIFAQSDSVYVDIGPCMAMEQGARKYACYDLLEEQIRASQAREIDLPVMTLQRNTRDTQQANSDTSTVSDVTESAEGSDTNGQPAEIADFGRESPGVTNSRIANARVLSNDDGEQELIDTISSLEERLPQQWEVTLEGGQVWHQVNSKNYRLRKGMEVRVYPSPFGGSFRMSATNLNGFIQVRRVQ